MADWVTISSLATAGGTLVLAVATFSSVRSSNRSARVAERSLYAGMRPVLIPSREDDPIERVRFGDEQLVVVPGHGGALDVGKKAIYLAGRLAQRGRPVWPCCTAGGCRGGARASDGLLDKAAMRVLAMPTSVPSSRSSAVRG